MPTINAGSSQTFTAGVRDQLFTLVVNGGALGTVTGAASASFGPGADRRAFGPFAVGQAITVTVQAGSVIVEYGDATPENDGSANSALNGPQVAAGAGGVAGAISGTPGSLVMLDGTERLTTAAYTWATLPAAADYIGNAFVSDVGARGSLWRSDGSAWGLVGGSCILAQSAVAATTLTGTTTETAAQNYTLPGNLMGLNGKLRIFTKWTLTNNANTKTLRFRFGGTGISGTALSDPQSTSQTSLHVTAEIENRNSLSSQIGGNGTVNLTGSTNAWRTATVNTATDQLLAITAQLGVGTDSVTLESYQIVLYRP